MRLADYPVIVVVWAMPGCANCEEYKPRFRKIAETMEGCVPAAVINCEDVDQGWLDHYGVQHVPATMVLRHGKVTARRDQAVSDDQIRHLFGLASFGLGC